MDYKDGIRAVFFDLDNTLWDFSKNSILTLKDIFSDSISRLCNNSVSCREFIDVFSSINEKLWEDYRQGIVSREVLRFLRFKKTFKELGIENDDMAADIEKRFVTETALKPHLIKSSIEILDYLYGKYKIGIITNGFIEAQEVKIKNSGIDKYIDYLVVSETAGYTKPNSGIFNYTLNTSGFNSSEVVYIGDDYSTDIAGAFNAGIKGIWYNPEKKISKNEFECLQIADLIELKYIF
jgi:HAD superfamily (subfamily IA) hydrolase, TIGR02254